jgi:hypothetical protein
MINTIREAIDYLYEHLRKTTTTISDAGKAYYEVDGRKYNEAEVIKLANSTNPATWFRS